MQNLSGCAGDSTSKTATVQNRPMMICAKTRGLSAGAEFIQGANMAFKVPEINNDAKLVGVIYFNQFLYV